MVCGDLEICLPIDISSPFYESAFQQRAGRPRKYKDSWFFGNKRIYLTQLMLNKLKAIKSSYKVEVTMQQFNT